MGSKYEKILKDDDVVEEFRNFRENVNAISMEILKNENNKPLKQPVYSYTILQK
jgi:hypothetical protein